MRFTDLAQETFSALDSNRGRSLLTVLGIVIGIGAVIAMTALIGGIKQAMMGDLGMDQARLVYINCWYGENGMRMSDVDAMAEELADDYEYVTATSSGGAEVLSATEKKNASITGTQAVYAKAMRLKMAQGRYFTNSEVRSLSMVVVLDQSGVKQLFGSPEKEVVGQSLTIGSQSYEIVGVVESEGFVDGDWFQIYMPMTTLNQRINGYEWIDSVLGFAHEGQDMDAVKADTERWLARHFNIPEDEREDAMWIQTMQSVIDEVNSVMASFQLLMTSVASISLLVGGIGIMNMMLTNVTERIREIGLRKALGARSSDITKQFLLESVCLCLVGGVIGIVLGYGASFALSGIAEGFVSAAADSSAQFVPVIDVQSVAMATGICVLIGVVFGYYPARRAAKLDPIEALHYQ